MFQALTEHRVFILSAKVPAKVCTTSKLVCVKKSLFRVLDKIVRVRLHTNLTLFQIETNIPFLDIQAIESRRPNQVTAMSKLSFICFLPACILCPISQMLFLPHISCRNSGDELSLPPKNSRLKGVGALDTTRVLQLLVQTDSKRVSLTSADGEGVDQLIVFIGTAIASSLFGTSLE